MATFLVQWESFGKRTHDPTELENWHDRYEEFSGPLHKIFKEAEDYIIRIKTHPEYGKTRRYRIYKFVKAIHG